MGFLSGKGTWSTVGSAIYDRVVARGQDALYERIIDEAALDVDRGAVLDVGAGPGHTALILARRFPGARIVGLDSSDEMVRRAAARTRAFGNVSFVRGDALALPFPEARFDAVISVASIKHWPDPARGLAEIHRVLVPGGRAVIIEADREAPRALVAAYAQAWPWVPSALGAEVFRRVIAAKSYSAGEASALIAASLFGGGNTGHVPGTPLWIVRAEKR